MKVEKKIPFYISGKGELNETYNLDILCVAIIKQAADDYRYHYRRGDMYECHRIERFFYSDWYDSMTNVSGEYLMKHIKEECRERYKRKKKVS